NIFNSISICLLLICLQQNYILSQRYRNPNPNNNNNNNRRLNGRSNRDDTIINVYPGGGGGDSKPGSYDEDAGVPPGANKRPTIVVEKPVDIVPENKQQPLPPPKQYDPKPVQNDETNDENDEEVVKNYSDEKIGANGCICVPYYQCDDGNIITDGSGIIDPRKIPKKEIPLDANYKPPFCGTFHVCCSDPTEASTTKPYVHQCGIRNPSGINRRILSPDAKGESDFGEWPWMAAVLKVENGINLFQCGGVLIDHQHVLTVVHCVAPYAYSKQYELVVRLGEWDTQHTNEFYAHEDYTVESVAMHPNFRNGSLWNDIAVLTLNKKVEFKPHIDSICLPTSTQDNFDGMDCVTTGWGKSAYKGGSYSNILKEVKLPVLNHYDCQTALRQTRLGNRFRLHDSFLCAGGEKGVDSCKGDGGGPLVCYRSDGTYALAGLVAWGIDCGKPGVPGVYVKVSQFLPWITKQTGQPIEDYWPQMS
ncbi:phenoloxidase-activating factor 2-like, partial [Oppia nitens]|uniref:phenoloxidase-activating factor 2-like n=1 Tax=Oppia nitens TaxID=1686743 RepID=UPI0023DB8990